MIRLLRSKSWKIQSISNARPQRSAHTCTTARRMPVRQMWQRCLGFLLILTVVNRQVEAAQLAAATSPARQSTPSSSSRKGGGPKNEDGSSSSSSSLQSSLSPLSSGRRACGLYLWDAPGALLHAWCTRLMRDCVYEGRGGRKFVRIEPGSVLQLLYPCSRFSPDRCLICGGTFRDHLTLWWSKNLYTPFDRILDDTYRDGVSTVVVGPPPTATGADTRSPHASKTDSSDRNRRGRQRPSKPSSQARREATRHMNLTPSQSVEHAFHRRYVVEEPVQSRRVGPGGKRVMVLVPRCLAQDDNNGANRDDRRNDSRTSPRSRRDNEEGRRGTSPGDSSSVFALSGTYAVRMPDSRNGTSSLLLLARSFAIEALGNLLELEANDDAKASRTR